MPYADPDNERTPSGVRTSSRSPSPTATPLGSSHHDDDWSLAHPSPFRRGEPFDLDVALDAATDFVEHAAGMHAPRERIIEVLTEFMRETGEPYSWGWFAKPSGEGLCRIDRAERYLWSGNLEEVV
jgi:hypothetical protein